MRASTGYNIKMTAKQVINPEMETQLSGIRNNKTCLKNFITMNTVGLQKKATI